MRGGRLQTWVIGNKSAGKRNLTALALVPAPQPAFESTGRINEMNYVVTGGAGFIGSNTVDELVRRGHSVVVLDDLSAGKEENLADVRNKITFMKGSITDLEAVQKAMHRAEYVLHLAARTSVPRSVKDPIETNRIN